MAVEKFQMKLRVPPPSKSKTLSLLEGLLSSQHSLSNTYLLPHYLLSAAIIKEKRRERKISRKNSWVEHKQPSCFLLIKKEARPLSFLLFVNSGCLGPSQLPDPNGDTQRIKSCTEVWIMFNVKQSLLNRSPAEDKQRENWFNHFYWTKSVFKRFLACLWIPLLYIICPQCYI